MRDLDNGQEEHKQRTRANINLPFFSPSQQKIFSIHFEMFYKKWRSQSEKLPYEKNNGKTSREIFQKSKKSHRTNEIIDFSKFDRL